MNSDFQVTFGDAYLSDVPSLRTFIENVHPFFIDSDPKAFWRCEPNFRLLLQTPFLTQILNYELRCLAEDNSYIVEGGTKFSLAIASTPAWSLSVRLIGASTATPRLLSNLQNTMIGVPECASPSIAYDQYEQTFIDGSLQLNNDQRLIKHGRIFLSPGSVLHIRAGIDVGQFVDVDLTSIVFVLSSRPMMSLQWEYDLDTLLPRRVIAGDVRSSRIEFATRLIAKMGNTSSLPQLWSLCRHQDHFVRWGAVRAIVAIDLDEGLRALEVAVSDIHPHVANAARSAIPKVKAFLDTGSA